MRIKSCENKKIRLEKLKKLLEEYMKEVGEEGEIIILHLGEKLFHERPEPNVFFQNIQKVIEESRDTDVGMKPIDLYRERVKYTFFQKDIKYVTAWDSSAEFILQGGVFRKETSLSEMEKILDTKIFFRVHRKYIVNMKWIERYENGIVVIDGEEKKVSERRRKEFEKKYTEYIYESERRKTE